MRTPSGPLGPNATRLSPPRLLADVSWTLPTDDVALGDSWAETHLVPWRDIPDALKVTKSYTYQGEEEQDQRRLDKIVVQARWDVQPMPEASRQLSVQRQVGTGVIYFDEPAGCLSRSEFSQELAIRVSDTQADTVQAEIATVLKIRFQPVIPAPDVTEAATAPSEP